MSCQLAEEKLHEYLDGELSPQETAAVRVHLSECEDCRQRLVELTFLQGVLATPVPLPSASQRQILNRIEYRSRRGWLAPLGELADSVLTYWRDLDKNIVRAKLVAVPFSLMFFVALAGQFQIRGTQEWTYAVFNRSAANQRFAYPVMVQVLQPVREINDLVETAWKLPYEDSLSLVAAIDRYGGTSIGHVLEYPKNSELLEKVGRTLQKARFDFDQTDSEAFIIYSFQKVDVYEGRGF